MIFNGGMTIWILAFLVLGASALAGWRQGAIRASFAFVGILFAALLASLIGKIFHPLLPHLGASNPLTAWALAPIVGFILVNIIFAVIAHPVHKRVEHYYKYDAGDLRLALFTRLNSRLGICLGLLNGVVYFILLTFLIFNLTYVTTQVAVGDNQPALIRLVNGLGKDLQSAHLSRTAAAVGTLPAAFYQYSDLAGFIMQNPQVGPRFVNYPGLTSLWERDDLQPLVTDTTLTNALAAGTSVGALLSDPSVQSFLENKDQTKLVTDYIQTNLDDLTEYLKTGKSAKYDGQKIIGHWEFNPAVTVAWLRQSRPKMTASEMRSIRAVWSEAYSNTIVLATGDNQLFVKNLPKFLAQPPAGQPPFTSENWKGDWSASDKGYDLHLVFNSDEKFLTATAENLRLSVKDGKNLLIFDRAD
jgi:uncharacterized membrane protein required for colicin V production